MWKNALIVVLLGVLGVELYFFGGDLVYFPGHIGIREVTIALLIVGTVVLARAIRRWIEGRIAARTSSIQEMSESTPHSPD